MGYEHPARGLSRHARPPHDQDGGAASTTPLVHPSRIDKNGKTGVLSAK